MLRNSRVGTAIGSISEDREVDRRVECVNNGNATSFKQSRVAPSGTGAHRRSHVNDNLDWNDEETISGDEADNNHNEEFYERLEQRLNRRLTLWENGLDEASISDVFKEDINSKVFRGKRKEGEHVVSQWSVHTPNCWTPSGRLGCASVAVGHDFFLFGGTGNGSTRTRPQERRYNANVVKYDSIQGKWIPLAVKAASEVPESDEVSDNQEDESTENEKADIAQEKAETEQPTEQPQRNGRRGIGLPDPVSNTTTIKRRLAKIGRSTVDLCDETAALETDMIQVPCVGATATAIGDNEVLVVGGESGFKTSKRHVFNSVFKFNTATCVWSQLHPKGSLPPQRRGHTTVLHHYRTRRLIIFGGMGPNQVFRQDNYLGDVQVLDIEGNYWAKKECTGTQPTPRMGHCSILVPGSTKMFMWGGISAEIVSSKGVPRMAYSLGKSIMTEEDDAWAPFAPPTVFELDVTTFDWQKVRCKGRTPIARFGHTAVVSNSFAEDIFIFGGQIKGGGTTNDIIAFNTTHSSWHLLQCSGPVPCPRLDHTAVTIGARMIVYGGANSSSYCDTSVYSVELHSSAEASGGHCEDAQFGSINNQKSRYSNNHASAGIGNFPSAFDPLFYQDGDLESGYEGYEGYVGQDSPNEVASTNFEIDVWARAPTNNDRCSFANVTPRRVKDDRNHPGELSSLGYFLDNANLAARCNFELPRPCTSPYGSILVSSRESFHDGPRSTKSRENNIEVSAMPRKVRGRNNKWRKDGKEWWRDHFALSEEMQQSEQLTSRKKKQSRPGTPAIGMKHDRLAPLSQPGKGKRPWTSPFRDFPASRNVHADGGLKMIQPEETTWARRIVKSQVSSVELAQKRAFKLKVINGATNSISTKLKRQGQRPARIQLLHPLR